MNAHESYKYLNLHHHDDDGIFYSEQHEEIDGLSGQFEGREKKYVHTVITLYYNITA